MASSRISCGIKNGTVVSVKNDRRNIEPLLIGEGCPTRVNANLGASPGNASVKKELEKARAAVEYGADAVMDLSVGGDLRKIRKQMLKKIPVPLGTVPVYEAFTGRNLDVTLDGVLKVVERQAREGVDFMTIHSGITQESMRYTRERIIPVTSRGGSFIAAWMMKHKKENPLYTGFDELMEILGEHDVVVSLGDALRPGALSDATDKAQLAELTTLGRLTKRARAAGVQVIVEGPGHVPLDQIEKNVKLEKKICHGAPFYVLGPLVTDIAVGYDHITGAIGGAVAAAAGADFLCYVTPSEHLGLPTVDDVREGVIASKIAAHAGDLVKLGDRRRDDRMSRARNKLDWETMFSTCLFPQVKGRYPDLAGKKECTMCGEYCALKIVREQSKKRKN